jgi:hypothetical protein
MTWHDFFNFSTMAHRHLVFSYMIVLGIQGGYFAWIAWNWRNRRNFRR